jgi:hypothetical protein
MRGVLGEFVRHHNEPGPDRRIDLDTPLVLGPTSKTSRPVERVDRRR